jgi:DNA-binding NarL/FixJ family response regulator
MTLTSVAVQHRQRLLRVGIGQLLETEDDVEVVASARTGADLMHACQQHRPAVALIEAENSDWDAIRLVAAVRRAQPDLAVIGLTASPASAEETARARRGGMNAVVSRDAGISGILEAVRAATNPQSSGRPKSITHSASALSPPTTLTPRELEILTLVGAGMTSIAASNRLNISRKTVENHKQRIFAKLGVQNQAHAVSVAMRTGLMRADRVMDLAVAD